MSRKFIVAPLIALVGVAVSLAALSAHSGNDVQKVDMDPGDRLVLECNFAFEENEFQMDPGYYDVECANPDNQDRGQRSDRETQSRYRRGDVQTVKMSPGDQVIVACETGFVENKFSIDPGYYDVECAESENTPKPEPTNTVASPTATSTATEPQQDSSTVDMDPGDELVLTCDSGFVENEFQMDPGYYDVECATDGTADGATTAAAQSDDGVQTVDMSPGDHLIVTCENEFVEDEFQMDPGYYDVECATASEPTASPTDEPTETATPTDEPTETATPTDEPTETVTPPQSDSSNSWHAPTDHEHGDAPPAWVTQFSQDTFGHGVVYGGDEGTPNENVYKHEGFKGYSVTFDGVEIYFRMHMMATPLGHQGRYHSYEAYARDASGNVSFWQGWLDFGTSGDSPTVRINGCDDTTVRPIMAVNVAEGCGDPSFESWYSRAGGSGLWSWDMGVNLDAPYYHGESVGNPSDPNDMSSWIETGTLGTTRRIELAWYDGRGAAPEGEWFCATVHGEILGTVTGPQQCADGLPQYIAPSMTTVSFPGNSVQRSYPDGGVTPPN